jgi:hypothetical protein
MSSNNKILDESTAPTVAFILALLLLAYIRKNAIKRGPSTSKRSSDDVPEDKEVAYFLLTGIPRSSLDAAKETLKRLGFSVASTSCYSIDAMTGSVSASDNPEFVAIRLSPHRNLVAKIAVAINLPVEMSYSLFDYRVQLLCGEILSHADIPYQRCICLQEPKPHTIRAELSESKLHLASHRSGMMTGNDVSVVGAERAVFRASVVASDSGIIIPAIVTILLKVPFLNSNDSDTSDFTFQIIFPFVTCLWVIVSVRQWVGRMDAVLAAADARYLHPPASIGGSEGGLVGSLRELFRSAHIVEFGLLVGIGAVTAFFIGLQVKHDLIIPYF